MLEVLPVLKRFSSGTFKQVYSVQGMPPQEADRQAFRARFEAAVARSGMNDSQLAAALDISPQALYQIKSGERPGLQQLPLIAEKLRVSVEWLRFGDVDKSPEWARGPRIVIDDRSAEQRAKEGGKHYNPNPIPMVGRVVAGDGKFSDRSGYQADGDDNLNIPDTWRAVLVEGNSAYPVVYPGQIVLIDTSRAARPGTPEWKEKIVDLHDNLCLIETDEPADIGKPTTAKRAYLKRFCMDERAPDGFVLASIDSGRSSPYVAADSILLVVPVVGVLFQDPRQPRIKRWHQKTVVVSIPPGQ